MFTEKQYSKLCELCDAKTGCFYSPQGDGNQNAALDCLTKKGGDVAYVAYYYVQKYFGVSSETETNCSDLSHTE